MADAEEIVIKVDRVSKDFILPHEEVSTLKSLFTGMLRSRDKTREMQHALRDISFEVKKGEFFGIVGRNGSGKSTLLKILANIYQPTRGSVTTKGRLVPFIELGVGFNGELTGRENVYLNGAMLGFSRKEIDDMYNDIVSFAELERFMDQRLKNYSSGMQVRLAFSMATRSEADILLVDEVLAVGDADFQRKCFNHFKKLKKENKTVVFVSHDMNAVREYCNSAIMIEQSRIVHAGAANEIATEYVRLFNIVGQKSRKDREGSGKERWGDGVLEFTSVAVKVHKDFVTLDMSVKANGDIEEPVFGYLIKDSAGHDLMGSNTKIKQLKTGTIHKGEHPQLTWKIPNVFNDGVFFITAAVVREDGVTQCDWWDNAASFTVYREDKTPYAINPDAEVELTR